MREIEMQKMPKPRIFGCISSAKSNNIPLHGDTSKLPKHFLCDSYILALCHQEVKRKKRNKNAEYGRLTYGL